MRRDSLLDGGPQVQTPALLASGGPRLMPRQNRSDDRSTRTLSIFLLKKSVTNPRTAVESDSELTWHSMLDGSGFDAKLGVLKKDPKEPWWPEFLREWVEGDLPRITTQTSSGVLMVHTAGRWFAVALGYGHYLLKDSSIERRFGMRVTLNCVDPDNLRSVDMRTLDDAAMHTSRQAGRGVSMAAFELTIARDLLRGVAGFTRPEYASFARSLAGKDSLVVSAPMTYKDIGPKCAEALRHFKRTDYQRDFGFIDELRPVDDPSTIEMLDDALVKQLSLPNAADVIAMVPPEMTEWQESLGYVFSSSQPSATGLQVLELADYLATLNDRTETTLRARVVEGKDRVYQLFTAKPQRRPVGTVYKCLAFETTHGGTTYVLCEDEWYEVNAVLASRVDKAVAAMQNRKLRLPPRLPGDRSEGDYNKRVAREDKGIICLDTKQVRPTGATSVMEACDLLTTSMEFIHVKPGGASSKLSHLVKQGENSAICYVEDPGYRQQIRSHVEKDSRALARRIPTEAPARDSFEVVFAIITSGEKGWPTALPFFTKLSLHLTHTALNRLSVRSTLVRIHDARNTRRKP